MANALYAKARERFLNGSISWENDTIVASLVNGSYMVDLVSHEFVSDLGSNLTGYAQTALTVKTSTLGVADAADAVWPSGSMDTTAPASGVVIYRDTGTASNSPLVAYFDTLISFPVTWDGISDITLSWSNGTDKIFAL
jgi:hypothetical protein